VIVNFLDGDPDRPIVTGRVYHGSNLPPYDLPGEKTKSTIKSNSTKDGGGNANEIRFEDLKDSEEFYTRAAKDQKDVIENNMTTEVRNNQVIDVENDRTVTVASGNETVTIENGQRDISVKANETHANEADFKHDVSGGYTLKVSGSITIEASETVTIKGAKVIINQ
ncbi:MAG: type VI secretion system tip protein VgrG, partial [Desulfatitalea sp.]|nr:type VI secretion system tip protein VgrG [Desulfatitalea sp.]